MTWTVAEIVILALAVFVLCGSVLAVSLLAWAVARMHPSATSKRSKASVDYQRGDAAGDCCGGCEHYEAYQCELVAGEVYPAFWCKLFRKRL